MSVLATVLLVMLAGPVSAQFEHETTEQRDARMKWWRQAKFGLFIHWGVYSVPAGVYQGEQVNGYGEWIMKRGRIPVVEYRKFARQFNPVKYDPDAWARLAQDTGMKYIVITSKHHDGFALFPSDITQWDIADASPYGKDLIGPLAQAARRHGLKFGLYYSHAQDWVHPGGAKPRAKPWDDAQVGDFDEYLKTIAVPQVREILTRYQPEILWWDTPKQMTPERAALFMPLFKNHPDIITNNRLGGDYLGDTETPEQHIPATGYQDRDWETCMTMNRTWGYKSYDDQWKPTEDLIHKLCDIVSKGGNFLLNVGPKSDGTIPQPSVDRLREIGQWMKVNGEAIYGTTANPFLTNLPWGRATVKADTLYLLIFDWPTDGRLLLPGLTGDVAEAALLAGKTPLATRRTPGGIVLELPKQPTDPYVSVAKVRLDSVSRIGRILPTQAADGTMKLSAASVDIHHVNSDGAKGKKTKVSDRYGEPNIGFWTDPRATVSWDFRAHQPGVFHVILEMAAQQESKFTVRLGDEKLEASTPRTGGYDQFKTITLGQIQIDRNGEYTLTIQPNAEAWKPINVRSVTLSPSDSPEGR